jgi:hypothetical protein
MADLEFHNTPECMNRLRRRRGIEGPFVRIEYNEVDFAFHIFDQLHQLDCVLLLVVDAMQQDVLE